MFAPENWWDVVETGGAAASGAPEWMRALSEAYAAELAFELDNARDALTRASGVPVGAWTHVHELLSLRVAVRTAQHATLEQALPRLRALIHETSGDELPTRARARHLLGVACIRLNRLDEAETALYAALSEIGDGRAGLWVVDTIAQVLVGQGAWEEARRTLGRVIAAKAADADILGVAISTGHLALLSLGIGEPATARAVTADVLTRHGDALGPMSRLRLATMHLDACLDLEDPGAIRAATGALRGLVNAAPEPEHYLTGYAALALARAAGDASEHDTWMQQARDRLTLPDHRAWVMYWDTRLHPARADDPSWVAAMHDLWRASTRTTQAEIRTLLLLASRVAATGDTAGALAHLDCAYDRATAANNALWVRWADDTGHAIAPEATADRISQRYTGRSIEELRRTVKEDTTVVFADLANFTARSQSLTPDDVMATVRSLFELTAQLMPRHRVRPIAYLGDGLLAVAQGEGHAQRGLAFARDVVRRTRRVSELRRHLGDVWGMDLRAGVATGPLVMGVLGSQLKLEFTGIGMTANRAARLQACAQPGEVVCDYATGRDRAREGIEEQLDDLKGIEGPVRTLRFPAGSD